MATVTKLSSFHSFKNLVGGVPQLSDAFPSGALLLSKGEPFIFGEFSQLVNPFYENTSLTVSRKASAPPIVE